MKNLLMALLIIASASCFAQTKPAYSVGEVTYINKDLYQKDLWPKIQKLVSDAGAEIIVAGPEGSTISGSSKLVDKITIIKFKSMEQAKSFYASEGYQQITPLAKKTVKVKLYLVEGQ